MSKVIETGDGTFFYSRKEQVGIKHLNIAKEILIETEVDAEILFDLEQVINKLTQKIKEKD